MKIIFASLIVFAVILGAQTQPKPTIGTVDDALKKADTDRQTQAADQAATAKKLLDGQNAAARAAGVTEERRREQLKSDENARDARLKQVEDTLAQVEKDKADALAAATAQQKASADKAAADHDALMKSLQGAMIGGAVTVVTGLIMMGLTQWKLGRIHKLVNSGYTAQMQNELSSLETTLITLVELRDLKLSSGAATNGAAIEAIEECREHVKTLGEQIKERLDAA